VIDETRRSLATLEQQFKLESEVTSPIAGRVIELLANEWTLIAAGTAIMNLESLHGNETGLEAVIYVNAEGSSLKPGAPGCLGREGRMTIDDRSRIAALSQSVASGACKRFSQYIAPGRGLAQ
jgi:hypothetical protein